MTNMSVEEVFAGGPAAPRRQVDVSATLDRDQDYALQFDLPSAARGDVQSAVNRPGVAQ